MTSFLAALGIGLAVSTGEPFGLIAAAGLPFVCMLAGIRKAAFENALAYYAAGLWPMMPGLHRYFGASEGPLLPFICWIASAMLLTLPWAAAWSDQRRALVWRVPLALLASCVPPIGIIGFISPLTAAGYLFPATEWVGVAAVWGWLVEVVVVGAVACHLVLADMAGRQYCGNWIRYHTVLQVDLVVVVVQPELHTPHREQTVSTLEEGLVAWDIVLW